MARRNALDAQRRDWDDLARLDPLWAILSHPERRYGRWDLDAFFAVGEHEIDGVLALAARLGLPSRRNIALDVGCGVGRLTRALATRFATAVGVDISSVMVERARELNRDVPNCEFVVAGDSRLASFADGSVDFVYSALVLQHLPSRREMRRYIGSFVRVVADEGVAAFQIPTRMPVRHRIDPGRRTYACLRALGIPEAVLYRRLGLTPMRIGWLPDDAVREAVAEARGRVVATLPYPRTPPAFGNTTYLVQRDG